MTTDLQITPSGLDRGIDQVKSWIREADAAVNTIPILGDALSAMFDIALLAVNALDVGYDMGTDIGKPVGNIIGNLITNVQSKNQLPGQIVSQNKTLGKPKKVKPQRGTMPKVQASKVITKGLTKTTPGQIVTQKTSSKGGTKNDKSFNEKSKQTNK